VAKLFERQRRAAACRRWVVGQAWCSYTQPVSSLTQRSNRKQMHTALLSSPDSRYCFGGQTSDRQGHDLSLNPVRGQNTSRKRNHRCIALVQAPASNISSRGQARVCDNELKQHIRCFPVQVLPPALAVPQDDRDLAAGLLRHEPHGDLKISPTESFVWNQSRSRTSYPAIIDW